MTEEGVLKNSVSPERALAHLRDAVARLAAGDARTALAAASEACWLEPRWPEAHYAYGQAWSALGEHSRAGRAFAEAVRLKPDWPDAWVNYGIARYRQGHIEDGKVAMRQALVCAPGHPAATANLGAFLRITGDSEGAEALLRQALAREPDNAGARLNLAADLLQEERATEALKLLEGAEPPAHDPRIGRHWRLQQSLALLQLGRAAEARAVLDAFEQYGSVPPALAPLWRWRRLLLAQVERDSARARQEAAAMEEALGAMGAEATPEHQIVAHYDLAKFWSGQGEHSRAFPHWVIGHRLLSRSQPFSRADALAFVEANIAEFSHGRCHDGPRAGNDDPAPVFIVGMPRSGTTLIEQILGAHGEAHGAGERAALGRAFAALGRGEGTEAIRRVAGLDNATLDAAARAYLLELKALAPGKRRIVDKMPGNYNYLGLVGLMLPGAKIIHCVRDPRDIGFSIFTFRFYGAHSYAHDLSDLGWCIGQHDRLMAHWKQALPNPILEVRLSDWVEDFGATLARVLAHLDLSPDPHCARFYEADSRVRTVSRAQVRQPINARGLGRWKTFANELAPMIEELRRAGALAAWEAAK